MVALRSRALVSVVSILAVLPIVFTGVSVGNAAEAQPEESKCLSLPTKFKKWGLNCDGWHIEITKVSDGNVSIADAASGVHSIVREDGGTQLYDPYNFWWTFAPIPNKNPLLLGKESWAGGPQNVTLAFNVWGHGIDNSLAYNWYRFIKVTSTANATSASADVSCGVYHSNFWGGYNGRAAVKDVGCDVLDRVEGDTGQLTSLTNSGSVDPTKNVRVQFHAPELGEWLRN
jgi:hypothetical protein